MTTILSLILAITFIILALIHFNWSFGGKWGFDKSLPANEKGEIILHPRKIDCAIVGFGLTGFGLFYLLQSGFIALALPDWLMNIIAWIIPTIFILRAIGEFKYVGFFKKIKNTEFGKLDSKLFSPLCFIIGVLGMLIQLMK